MTQALHSVPVHRLGKRPPDPAKPRLRFGNFVNAAAVPPHPLVDPGPASLNLQYPMDENDAWGDCVVAGADHALQVIHALLGIPYTNWSRDQILAYYRTQNLQFDPADPDHGPGSEDDGGMFVQDFLSYLVKQGVILGFGSIDHTNEDELKAAVWLGLAVPTGETLTERNLQEKIWDHHSDAVAGGHCTVTVDYRGGSTDYEDQVSWGDLYGMTQAFIRQNVDEAWFIITRAHVDHPGFRAGFDLTSFSQAYEVMTGRPFPVAVDPPPPGPQPTPTPTPVPPAPVVNPFQKAVDAVPGLAAALDRLTYRHNVHTEAGFTREEYVAWRLAGELHLR